MMAWLNPPGGGKAKPMDAAKVQSLLGHLTSRAKAVARQTKAQMPASAAPTTSQTPAAASSADDDVPF